MTITGIRFGQNYQSIPAYSAGKPAPSSAQAADAFSRPAVAGARRTNVVRFGFSRSETAKNGLFITVERAPAKVGGLGEVSETIPEAMHDFGNGKDLRVLMPLLGPIKAEGGFEDTGVSKQLIGPDGKAHTFKLLQKYEERTKTWLYAIDNDTFFGNHKNLYLPKGKPVEGLGDDAMFRAVMMFNRAAAAFTPTLNGDENTENTKLARFDDKIDFVWTNDWLTGPYLSELPKDLRDSVGLIGQWHNTFDERRKQHNVKRNHLKVPDFLSRRSGKTGKPTGALKEEFSPLSILTKLSDAIFINRNYARTILFTDFGKGQQATKYLLEKFRLNKVFDIHHGLSDEVSAFNNEALKTDGFTELKNTTPAEVARYKRTNKLALQKSLGLKQDSDAIVMGWAARFDPRQKGFYLLMNETEKLLRNNPRIQLVIAGVTGGNPIAEAWVKRMNETPEFKGRLYLPNSFIDRKGVSRLNAGADFTILPSLYEPYGLTQLEAKKLLSIPVVHGVDGLRTTVSDPQYNAVGSGERERVWDYGQTGVMMEPVDVVPYQRAQSAFTNGNDTPEQQAILDDAQKKFSNALSRAVKLAENPAKATEVRINGLQYVENEHKWNGIIQRYIEVIDKVVAEKKSSLLAGTPFAKSA